MSWVSLVLVPQGTFVVDHEKVKHIVDVIESLTDIHVLMDLFGQTK